MSSGKIIQDEFGSFEDEVMNAGWVPAQAEVQLGLQDVHTANAVAAPNAGFDADAFLNNVYISQE
ncbi:hypothetical protein [Denitratisoma sp. agr-D3]